MFSSPWAQPRTINSISSQKSGRRRRGCRSKRPCPDRTCHRSAWAPQPVGQVLCEFSIPISLSSHAAHTSCSMECLNDWSVLPGDRFIIERLAMDMGMAFMHYLLTEPRKGKENLAASPTKEAYRKVLAVGGEAAQTTQGSSPSATGRRSLRTCLQISVLKRSKTSR